jgi:hypothetical protein
MRSRTVNKEAARMGVATSIVVFAIGAILRFATTVHSSSFNIHTIGVILMVAGVVGFLVSVIYWSTWGGFGGWTRSRTTYRSSDGRVVEEHHNSRY